MKKQRLNRKQLIDRLARYAPTFNPINGGLRLEVPSKNHPKGTKVFLCGEELRFGESEGIFLGEVSHSARATYDTEIIIALDDGEMWELK